MLYKTKVKLIKTKVKINEHFNDQMFSHSCNLRGKK